MPPKIINIDNWILKRASRVDFYAFVPVTAMARGIIFLGCASRSYDHHLNNTLREFL